ncbi:hypothetical protein K491DRAFT_679804 [Lophiostoma macrostomum CBS 122681]|uniref:DUF676 domain-containing protein n=1 Tax=Lophiostoma macrostomum CBS 122681 TaxID=1314788 RepID=A0A6A6T4V9_9PLEO|nr:hypothetical protein K491DRAFT_679804 [Lophiostoma macrostomum CBS 122681]
MPPPLLDDRDYGPLLLTDENAPGVEVDIIFLHGLHGHRKDTWTYKDPDGTECFWPQDLLPKDLPNARIYSYGYDADVIKFFDGVAVVNLDQYAQTLCIQLSNIQQSIEKASAPELKAIFDDTAGLLFLGTPHAGSEHADFGSFFATLLKLFRRDVNTSPVKDLRVHNPNLQEAERRFTQLLAKRKELGDAIDVRCFCEGKAMNAITGFVVPTFSAIPPYYSDCMTMMRANHVEMTKFSGPDDSHYKDVLATLKKMIAAAKEHKSRDRNENAATKEAEPTQVHSVKHVGNNDRGASALYGSQTYSGDGNHIGNNNTFG